MKRYGNLSDPTLDISRHNYAAVLDHVRVSFHIRPALTSYQVTIKFPILRGLTPDPVKVVALDYLRSYHRHLNEPRKPKVNRLRRRSRVVVDA